MSGELSDVTATSEQSQEAGTSSDDVPVVPLRRPGRWAAATAMLVFAAWLVKVLVTTEAFEWHVVGHYLFSSIVLSGVLNTLLLTALCMTLGVVLGTVVAIMRLSPNPVLTAAAAGYQWFFRGVPTLVQMIFWFNLASVFETLKLGMFGFVIFSAPANDVITPFVAALLGLGLAFSAYYSEIVRAGLLSVDEGQSDAAAAYGLGKMQTLRHIVVPQAMRVIIPPTGNEVIGMLKYTSLASVVAYHELLFSVGDVYTVTFQVIPLLITATLWYLAITSIFSIGQIFVERRFRRGTQRNPRASWVYTQLARRVSRGGRHDR